MLRSNWFPLCLFLVVSGVIALESVRSCRQQREEEAAFARYKKEAESADTLWRAPSLYADMTTRGAQRQLILYGEELIVHTARYLGPRGSISQISNGMNCQNCHLEGGAKAWAFNFAAVAATYPQFRARSAGVVNIAGRINGCFQRSLNGEKLDTGSTEMKAMIAYLEWIGRGMPRGRQPQGNSIAKLPYLERPADPEKGKALYAATCSRCHGAGGQGQWNADSTEYSYPPLWGPHSYNDGAGLYRLSKFAGFIKNNMPFGTSYLDPVLTDEQAWDIAAYVDSRPRPHKDQSADWKDIATKPLDFPAGPYADSFPEDQHKYGPYQPIKDFYKANPGGIIKY